MSGALVANSSELSGGGGGAELNLVEETASALRPKADGVTDSGDSSHAWRRGFFDNITLDGVDLDTRISSVETTADKSLKPIDLLPVINRIGALEDAHALAIADGIYETAGGDQIELASGLVVAFTKGAGGGGGVITPGLTGLRITQDSATELTVASGAIHNHDLSALIRVNSPLALDLTESGDFVNASTRATNTWYHVLIGHETSSGNVVAGLSTTLAKPSGWDDWQMIGAVKTDADGSGNLVAWKQTADFFERTAQYPLDYFDYRSIATSIDTTVKMTRAWCPPIQCQIALQDRRQAPNVQGNIGLFADDGVTPIEYLRYVASSTGLWTAVVQWTTDATGHYYWAPTNATTFSDFFFTTHGFFYPRGEAGAYA